MIVSAILFISFNANSTNFTEKRKLTGLKESTDNGRFAIGVRLGDPVALSIKKYIKDKNALEFNFGFSPHGFYNYNNRFKYYYNDSYYFNSYKPRTSLVLQGRYLFNFPLAVSGFNGLSIYAGVGVQMRFTTIEFYYTTREYYGYDKRDYYVIHGSDKRTMVDFGLDGIIGLEWKIPKAPISLFIDANLYFEVFHRFGVRPQGGLGGRLHF